MFNRVLIANRGEIAARIARTCRRLGIATVGVTSWADRDALHARVVDTAVALGPSASRHSYLDIDRILNAARRVSADAVHPGYGFLSENPEFAARCEEAGFRWIGPSAEAIRLMGDKHAARTRMEQTGVPVLPGFAVESSTDVSAQCRELGYPVLVKAIAGGGGRGLRRAETEGDLDEALHAAAREAAAAFGDGRLLVEKLVTKARHVEVQVLADSDGRTVHLFERDCSLQRRHQKVIEEAPAPGLHDSVRSALTETACRAAEAIGYENAGTVEFLLGPDGHFYFIEMNTRLQVEHPVTECITGVDLVEWQLRVAAGEPLGFDQDDLRVGGHAIEARVCAEDPEQDFRPQPGSVRYVSWPEGEGIRVDAGVETGDRIPPHYDSLIAKVVAWGEDREEARSRLVVALHQIQCAGPVTNVGLLTGILEDPAFREGQIDTTFIPERIDSLASAQAVPDDEVLALAAFAAAQDELLAEPGNPWMVRDGWRTGGPPERTLVFARGDQTVPVTIAPTGTGNLRVTVGDRSFTVTGTLSDDGHLEARVNAGTVRARAFSDESHVWLFTDTGSHVVTRLDRAASSVTGLAEVGDFACPMPGRVVDIPVKPGMEVEAGATLVVVEAMKIEHRIQAPSSGRVTALLCEEGAWIGEGEPLVEFEPLAA